MTGTLYLLPTPLAPNAWAPFPEETLQLLRRLDVFIVERGKTVRQFLKEAQTTVPFPDMTFFELNKYTKPEDLPNFLAPALAGKDIGLMSEAGCPGIADPGAEVVQYAHNLGIPVVPLVGPSSILLALMGSGLNGQRFAFHGYLPIKNPARKKMLRELERQSRQWQQTQIFIETPYRNDGLIADMLSGLQPQTRLCIASDLTAPNSFLQTKTLLGWKRDAPPRLHKRPTIFLFLAP